MEYNAENRPVRWTQGTVVITMEYDRLGRRVFYKEMDGNRQVTYTKFLYDGYLCIQQLFSNSPWNVYKEFVWDPTEPVATRPLCFRQYGQRSAFLMHDGNKNVTDVVTVGPFNEPVAHYDYAPFGAPAATGSHAADNPFRFSSEFHDPTLALVYYNYRHYNSKDARWLGRDVVRENFVREPWIARMLGGGRFHAPGQHRCPQTLIWFNCGRRVGRPEWDGHAKRLAAGGAASRFAYRSRVYGYAPKWMGEKYLGTWKLSSGLCGRRVPQCGRLEQSAHLQKLPCQVCPERSPRGPKMPSR